MGAGTGLLPSSTARRGLMSGCFLIYFVGFLKSFLNPASPSGHLSLFLSCTKLQSHNDALQGWMDGPTPPSPPPAPNRSREAPLQSCSWGYHRRRDGIGLIIPPFHQRRRRRGIAKPQNPLGNLSVPTRANAASLLQKYRGFQPGDVLFSAQDEPQSLCSGGGKRRHQSLAGCTPPSVRVPSVGDKRGFFGCSSGQTLRVIQDLR